MIPTRATLRKNIYAALFAAMVTLTPSWVYADSVMMVRLERAFPEAMNVLQEAIKDHGYRVTRIQRVDVGLSSRGFSTAEYRVVYFGKPEEMKRLPDLYPDLMPYLPLKIVLFAEGDTTLALTYNPTALSAAYADPGLSDQFRLWERDLRSILDQYAHTP